MVNREREKSDFSRPKKDKVSRKENKENSDSCQTNQ